MIVLVDTSVWSLALRAPAKEPKIVAKLRKHVQGGRVVLLGVIVQELLQGFRDDRDVTRVATQLEAFPLVQLSRDDHVAAATLHRACAKRGVTASTIDCHIASAAIRHRCSLLTNDDDFTRIARVAPSLRLA